MTGKAEFLPDAPEEEIVVEQLRYLMLHSQDHKPVEYCALCGRLEAIKALLLLPFKEPHADVPR